MRSGANLKGFKMGSFFQSPHFHQWPSQYPINHHHSFSGRSWQASWRGGFSHCPWCWCLIWGGLLKSITMTIGNITHSSFLHRIITIFIKIILVTKFVSSDMGKICQRGVNGRNQKALSLSPSRSTWPGQLKAQITFFVENLFFLTIMIIPRKLGPRTLEGFSQALTSLDLDLSPFWTNWGFAR